MIPSRVLFTFTVKIGRRVAILRLRGGAASAIPETCLCDDEGRAWILKERLHRKIVSEEWVRVSKHNIQEPREAHGILKMYSVEHAGYTFK